MKSELGLFGEKLTSETNEMIRISHRVCGGLAGFWLNLPKPSEDTTSPNYIGPGTVRILPDDEICCGKCGCQLTIADMDWPERYSGPDFSKILSVGMIAPERAAQFEVDLMRRAEKTMVESGWLTNSFGLADNALDSLSYVMNGKKI